MVGSQCNSCLPTLTERNMLNAPCEGLCRIPLKKSIMTSPPWLAHRFTHTHIYQDHRSNMASPSCIGGGGGGGGGREQVASSSPLHTVAPPPPLAAPGSEPPIWYSLSCDAAVAPNGTATPAPCPDVASGSSPVCSGVEACSPPAWSKRQRLTADGGQP